MTERPPLSIVPKNNITDLGEFRRRKAERKGEYEEGEELRHVRQALAKWAQPSRRLIVHEMIHSDVNFGSDHRPMTRLARIIENTLAEVGAPLPNPLDPLFHQSYEKLQDNYQLESLETLRATHDTQIFLSTQEGKVIVRPNQVELILRAILSSPGRPPIA